jgi:hypothetical protein
MLLRWLSSGLQRRVDWYEFINVSEDLTASETLVNLHQSTRPCNLVLTAVRTLNPTFDATCKTKS